MKDSEIAKALLTEKKAQLDRSKRTLDTSNAHLYGEKVARQKFLDEAMKDCCGMLPDTYEFDRNIKLFERDVAAYQKVVEYDEAIYNFLIARICNALDG